MFLRGMRFLSPCQIGQAGGSVTPTPGGRDLSLGAPATIHLNSSALVMLRVTVLFFARLQSGAFYTNPPEPPFRRYLLAKRKAIGLFTYCQWNLLLFLEHDEEKGSRGELPRWLTS